MRKLRAVRTDGFLRTHFDEGGSEPTEKAIGLLRISVALPKGTFVVSFERSTEKPS